MQASIRISVVTPSLDHGRYIEHAILSILQQQYKHFEHVVVDGNSTDDTLEILRKYSHLRWISEPDAGQTAAINKGIRMVTGDVFAYLNADDFYYPGAFETAAAIFQEDPTTAVLIGDCDAVSADSRVIERYRASVDQFEGMLRFWDWGHRFCIPQPAVFLRRDVIETVGFFDEQYDLAMDYEMWLRLATRYPFTVVHQTLAACRVTEDTKTIRKRRQADLESFRASRKFWRLARWPDRWVISCLALAQRALMRGPDNGLPNRLRTQWAKYSARS